MKRKTYQQVQLFQMQPVQFQNRTYQDLLKNKTDEANFQNILTELYKEILTETKLYLKQLTCMLENFSLTEIT
jgi:hypothetical protein